MKTLLLTLSLVALSRAFVGCKSRSCRPLLRLSSEDNEEDASNLSKDFKKTATGSYVDSSAVDFIVSEIKSIIALKAPKPAEGSVTAADLSGSFAGLLEQLRSVKDEALVKAELSMLKKELQEGVFEPDDSLTVRRGLPTFPTAPFQTTIYSTASSPVCVVYGPGPVGQRVLSTLKALEPAVKVKRIDGNQLATMQDSELTHALRDTRSIIVAADLEKAKPSGWFAEEPAPVVSQKAFKRLVNAAVMEREKGSVSNVRVVILGQACQEKKGFASILLSGDAGTMESDAVLQCKARGLEYALVKTGQIIGDDAPMPSGVRNRNLKSVQGEIETPLATTFGTVEANEVTRVSVASEALLRATSHPNKNMSISVLSSYCSGMMLPSDIHWNDEFLKTEGPELARIPICYTRKDQMVLRLTRLVEGLQKPGTGLVTPIEVERFSNGVRVQFRPPKDNYLSSKEERSMEKKNIDTADKPAPKKSGYLSPEQEAILLQGAAAPSEKKEKSKKLPKPEGGLEVIVEDEPYRRVRVRRCSMGSDTIVKEESEALILKQITRAVNTLENDLQTILTSAP